MYSVPFLFLAMVYHTFLKKSIFVIYKESDKGMYLIFIVSKGSDVSWEVNYANKYFCANRCDGANSSYTT